MMKKPAKITPAMRQFFHFKEQYPDAVLFFRMGDFYETFYEDAKIGAGSVVITSVPAHATVVGVPGRVVAVRNPDTDTIEKLPDPVGEKLEYLENKLEEMEQKLSRLEEEKR